MRGIDEMFVDMEKDRAAVSLARKGKMANAARKRGSEKRSHPTLNAGSALVSSLTNDVNEFNSQRERVGQTPVRISRWHFQCEIQGDLSCIHLPGRMFLSNGAAMSKRFRFDSKDNS
jgi:hypothetical protein